MSQPRILIVDDEADIREILALELLFEKCDVVECASFLEASQRVGQEAFDLIISDMSLGDGNGLQLLRLLREDLKSETPFVLMSGDIQLNERMVKAVGGSALVSKPFYLPDLVPRIFSWVDHSRFPALKAS